MRSTHMVAVMVAAAAALTACMTNFAGSAETRGRSMMIALTGAAEGPGLGDPDGSGMAELLFRFGAGFATS